MEYNSQVYKTSVWPSFSMLSAYTDTKNRKTLMDCLSHLFAGKRDCGTSVINERGKTSTQSVAVVENAESYMDIQEMVDGVIAPQSEAKKRLWEIAKLNNNWNDHGAESFSAVQIERVSQMIDSFPVAPEIYPTAIGAIQIEYRKDEERLHRFYYSEEAQKNDPGLKLVLLVSIDKEVCDRNSVAVIDDPLPEENIHHCLLFKNQEREKLTQS